MAPQLFQHDSCVLLLQLGVDVFDFHVSTARQLAHGPRLVTQLQPQNDSATREEPVPVSVQVDITPLRT